MSGEQKTAEQLLREVGRGVISKSVATKAMQEYADQQSAALKSALAELIPIADYYHDREVTYTGMPYKTWNDIIDRARKLLNKQPQSESDKIE